MKRLCTQAKTRHDWTVVRLARESGVSRNTIYRWIAGDLDSDPDRDKVEAFVKVVDERLVQEAFDILWPPRGTRPTEPAPLPPPPAVETLLRRLEDPNISNEEKYLILETLNALAARTPKKTTPRSDTTVNRRRRTG